MKYLRHLQAGVVNLSSLSNLGCKPLEKIFFDLIPFLHIICCFVCVWFCILLLLLLTQTACFSYFPLSLFLLIQKVGEYLTQEQSTSLYGQSRGAITNTPFMEFLVGEKHLEEIRRIIYLK